MRGLILLLIKIYRWLLSPVLPPQCRFTPSCSEYAELAIERHGVLRGMYLSARRVLKCHPFHAGGYDPVPEQESISNKNHRCGTHD
ncbi:MAG TPA: membrane protein insertion efficiency factor YidD [Gammaproteobacteria bacterium]|nr:membrane protein insertion efficiency factor YidD [Gammaproteobacteria bacterium]